uniref:Uncharacterized protein n=1 Tax=Anguilla anguilla TaxID=7936 RepID=A0A0E9QCL3_ANGAN
MLPLKARASFYANSKSKMIGCFGCNPESTSNL